MLMQRRNYNRGGIGSASSGSRDNEARYIAGSATQVLLLRKPHTKTTLIFNALRRQYMPSSITCVALPKRHIMPAKALDRPLPLDNARAYAVCGLPACRSSPAPWRGVFVGFHALSVP